MTNVGVQSCHIRDLKNKIDALQKEISYHESIIRTLETNRRIHQDFESKYWGDVWKRIHERPEVFFPPVEHRISWSTT